MKKTTYAAIKMNIYLKGFTSKGDGLSHFKRIVLFIDPNLNQKKGLKRVSQTCNFT